MSTPHRPDEGTTASGGATLPAPPFAGDRWTLAVPRRLHTIFFEELGLALLGLLAILLARKAGVNLLPAALLPGVFFWVVRKSVWQARTLVFGLCTGSDPASLAYFLFLCAAWMAHTLLVARSTRVRSVFGPLIAFAAWCLASTLVSQAREINLLALPFWLTTVLSPIGVYLYFTTWRLERRDWPRLLLFLASVGIVQCALSWAVDIRPVGFRAIWGGAMTPDIVLGTLSSATTFGVILLQITTVILAVVLVARPKGSWFLTGLVGLFLVFIYTCDTKTFLIAFAIGWLIAYFIATGLSLTGRRALGALALGVVALVVGPAIVLSMTERYETVYVNYLFGESNRKVQFLTRAVSPANRSLADYAIGFGPGTCGSRAGNMRAYDTLHKDNQSQSRAIERFVPAYTSSFTREYVADLWTVDYFNQASSRSALLGNPFNSWSALWLEAGVVGVALWFIFLAKVFAESKRKLAAEAGSTASRIAAWALVANTVTLLLTGIITQSLETPVVMAPFWLLLVLVHAGGRTRRAEVSHA